MKSIYTFIKSCWVLILFGGTAFAHCDMHGHNETNNHEDSIVKTINGNKITLISVREESSSAFEPRYRNQRILINNSFLINVDSLCQLKSDLFNPSFNFYSSSVKVIKQKKRKQYTHIKIFLGQEGCSGDFCSDLIVTDIIIERQKITFSIYDN